jgi:large subunit ribosomal protein L10
MPNQTKIDQVAVLTDIFKQSPSVAVTDYSGLTVEKATRLRKELRDKKIRYVVAKNTLLKIAAKNAGMDGLDDYLKGPSAVAFGSEDAGAMAKIIYDFGKANEKPAIKAIYLEGNVYPAAAAEKIAKMPTKDQLMAMVCGNITAPIQNFVGTLDAVIRKFIGTVDALKEKMNQS